MFDRAKALIELKKIQSALAKEMIEVEAGDGAVMVKINGEQKIQKISLDPDKIDFDDLGRLEKWIESAITQAITKSQQAAADKMKAISGGLGIPGL
ncbi:MAG TPA: YbaB/EbfC family nucleoid-associated protein [Candidatus Saccharimonadales bacterium]|nr:YbaB/EbfC family nucleoid-associated protein [Candidatus Saccharimonadales bacterium]